MKFLLLTAALLSVAVAGPTRFLPGLGAIFGPSPAIVTPDVVASAPVAEPISVGPAIVDVEPVEPATPLVQIIVNVKNPAAAGPNPVVVEYPVEAESPVVPQPIEMPAPAAPIVIAPTPVQVVDSVPEAVIVASPTFPELVVPEPIAVAEPTLPVAPVDVAPETLN